MRQLVAHLPEAKLQPVLLGDLVGRGRGLGFLFGLLERADGGGQATALPPLQWRGGEKAAAGAGRVVVLEEAVALGRGKGR